MATATYSIDWTTILAGDTIASSSWVLPAALTQVAAPFTTTEASIQVNIDSAVQGVQYELVNTIITALPATKGRSLFVIPVPLDSNALITLSYLTSFLKRTPSETDPHNALFAALINGISSRIATYCNRTFHATNYVERVDITEELVVRNQPILYVEGIYLHTQPALRLVNAAANMVQALAWIAPDRKLYLKVVGGASSGTQTIDLTASATDTLAELVTAVNALATGWTASLVSGKTGYEPCTDLVESTPVRVTASGGMLDMLGDPTSLPYQIDYGAGIIRFEQTFEQDPYMNRAAWLPNSFQPLGSRQSFGDDMPLPYGWIKLRGGFETIPADLQLLAARIIAQVYSTPADESLTSETIGEYSYTRALSAEMDKAISSFAKDLEAWRNHAI
jgi:hypothetical protein